MRLPKAFNFILALLCQHSVAGYGVPRIIQGGMGIRISSWQLARAVSRKGELGVISGTSMDTVFVRTLQIGDPTGEMRRALATFPDQAMAQRMLDKFFIEGGKDEDKSFRPVPMWTLNPSQVLEEATVCANYCEVWLAKHNDDSTPTNGIVGINRLTKVPLPTPASLYGAMLADVDYVIMGAGIPLKVPGVLDNLAEGKDASFPVDVSGGDGSYAVDFSPSAFWGRSDEPIEVPKVKRPSFVPIVSSVVLAKSMLKRANGKGPTKGIDGFVVELPSAGGHNAPPRGFRYDPVAKSHELELNEKGEPVYGPKDDVDLTKFLKAVKGIPFWLAGSYARPEKFGDILKLGGTGVQVGSAFSLAKESGMDDEVRQQILQTISERDMEVFTDPVASPTGYPFKVLQMDDSLSEEDVYEERPRQCSLGYLRTPYIDDKTGKIGYRCPAEPVDDWLKKGGELEATVGRKCLCNALCANIGLPQTRTVIEKDGDKKKRYTYVEEKLITVGDEVNQCRHLMKQDENGKWSFSAADVIDYLNTAWDEVKSVEEELVQEKVAQEVV